MTLAKTAVAGPMTLATDRGGDPMIGHDGAVPGEEIGTVREGDGRPGRVMESILSVPVYRLGALGEDAKPFESSAIAARAGQVAPERQASGKRFRKGHAQHVPAECRHGDEGSAGLQRRPLP